MLSFSRRNQFAKETPEVRVALQCDKCRFLPDYSYANLLAVGIPALTILIEILHQKARVEGCSIAAGIYPYIWIRNYASQQGKYKEDDLKKIRESSLHDTSHHLFLDGIYLFIFFFCKEQRKKGKKS